MEELDKKRLQKEIEEKLYQKRREMTKLQHLKGSHERIEYLKEVGIKEASDIIRIRLELKDIGSNQGQQRTSAGCRNEKESTEHIMQCKETWEMLGMKGNILWINGKIGEIRKITKYIKKYIENGTEKSFDTRGKHCRRALYISFK